MKALTVGLARVKNVQTVRSPVGHSLLTHRQGTQSVIDVAEILPNQPFRYHCVNAHGQILPELSVSNNEQHKQK